MIHRIDRIGDDTKKELGARIDRIADEIVEVKISVARIEGQPRHLITAR